MSTYTRVLVGQATTQTVTLYADGTVTDLGTLTYGITDATGATVVAAGSSVTDAGNGTYTYTLAKQTAPKFLIVALAVGSGPDFEDYIEVVGSELFNEAQLRAFDDGAISDTTTYTDALIAQARDRVTDFLEQQTGRSWIRRYARVELSGSGGPSLYLSEGQCRTSVGLPLDRSGRSRDVIRLLTVDGSAPSSVEVTASGTLLKTDGYWTRWSQGDPFNVTVEYEYGLPYPIDGVDRIAMKIARNQLVANRIPGNAVGYSNDLGSFQFDPSRLDREAWEWIKSHRAHAPFG